MAISTSLAVLNRRENFALHGLGKRFGFGSGGQAEAVAEVTSQGEIVGRVFRIQFGIKSGDFEQVLDDLVISCFSALDRCLHHLASGGHYEIPDEAANLSGVTGVNDGQWFEFGLFLFLRAHGNSQLWRGSRAWDIQKQAEGFECNQDLTTTSV